MTDEQAVEQEEQQADSTGQDDAEGKAQQREERDPATGEAAEDEEGAEGVKDEDDEAAKAKKAEEQRQQAKETIKKLEEEGPPEDLADWPDDASKYETYGGPEGEHSYEEGPERKLGPSSLRHRLDGGVEIEGEEGDDPKEYKGEPIPGGPTDPNASLDLTTKRIRERQGRDIESDEAKGTKADDDSDGSSPESKSESGDES